jgi:hypothetical protein
VFARGGLALDGVYPKGVPSALATSGFFNAGGQFAF